MPSAATCYGICAFCCSRFYLVCLINDYRGFLDGARELRCDEKSYISSTNFIKTVNSIDVDTREKSLLALHCRTFLHVFIATKTRHISIFAISAPMWCGKTVLVSNIVKERLLKTILLIIYRQSLAYQLSQQIEALCYLETTGTIDTNTPPYPKICEYINSFLRINRNLTLNCIIWVEMNLVRRHLVENIYTGVYESRVTDFVLHCAQLVVKSKAVYGAQGGLSHKGFHFLQICREAADSTVDIPRHSYYVPTQLGLVQKMIDKFVLWLVALTKECVTEKVLCNMRETKCAVALHSFVLHHCVPKHKTCEEWEDEVALITSTQVFPQHKLNSSKDFVSVYTAFPVTICTSVLESGVSFSCRFTDAFSYCSTKPLTYPASARLTRRVKTANCVILFVENRKPISACQEVVRIKTNFLDCNISAPTMTSLLSSTFETLLLEFVEVTDDSDLLQIYEQHSDIVDEDIIESGCDADGLGVAVNRIHFVRVQEHSLSSNSLWYGTSAQESTLAEHSDFLQIPKFISLEYWKMRLTEAHGLVRLVRYSDDDTSALRAPESINTENSVAMSTINASEAI